MSDGASAPQTVDPRYIAARRVLLDAIEALTGHHEALIVVGAQAVYLRTGSGELGIAPFTTDGDLALDPTLLAGEPQLEAAMTAAGFTLREPSPDRIEPGIWLAEVDVDGDRVLVPVDLIVPEGVAAAGGRRGARLGPHGKRAARRAAGLEAALVDHSPMIISALEHNDPRSFELQVAGPASLLIAKAHKIHDRIGSPRADRADDKDAADVYRLMQTTQPLDVARRVALLRRDPVAGSTTESAITYLRELFGRRGAPGIAMAARALRLAIAPDQVMALSTAYVQRFLVALDERPD